jgi:hypothetical protein
MKKNYPTVAETTHQDSALRCAMPHNPAHESLLRSVTGCPCRVIQINGSDYLHRFFMGHSSDGGQIWLHHFLREDSERHLHTHAWRGTAIVLTGQYTECLATDSGNRMRTFSPGWVNQIHESTLHRIVSVEPNTWTLLHIKPGRAKYWAFIDDEGNRQEVESAGEEWYLHCAPLTHDLDPEVLNQ